MNEHEEIRGLLALAAAGALEEEEELRVATHIARCAACAAEAETWQALAQGLRLLPTPVPSAGLVERVKLNVVGELETLEEARASEGMVRAVVIASWGLLAATAAFAGGWSQWLVGTSTACLGGGAVLLVLLAYRRKMERRLV